MSAVEQALLKLNQVLGKLETSVSSVEINLQGQQRDMFSTLPPGANGNAVSPEMVAQKLDTAIETLETVLNEGEA